MEKEIKYKIIILSLVVFFMSAGFSSVIFGGLDFSVFLIISGFAIIFLLIVEAYLRIQHNIDKTANAVSIVNSQGEKIAQTQDKLCQETETARKVYENIIDLLEILADYLEEEKKKESGTENL